MGTGEPRLDLLDRGRAALNLTAAHLAELVAELAPLFTGARVVEVRAHPPRDVELLCARGEVSAGKESGGERPLALALSADADLPRVFLRRGRRARHDGPPGPFLRRLETELVGARLTRLEQVAGDRILRLEFDGTPSGERRVLFAELVGRHANLLLAGPGERLLEWLVPPPESAGKAPRLALGEPWCAPPGKPARAATEVALSSAIAQLSAPSSAPSSALGSALGSAPGSDSRAAAPALPGESRGESLGESLAEEGGTRAPLSWLVEHVLGAHVAELSRARDARDLRERLERRAARARSLVHGLVERRAAAQGAERVLQDGELLKANLARVARGAKTIEVDDWFVPSGARRAIALDPRRSPQENVTAIFERYHKLLRGADDVERELASARERAATLERLLAALAAPDSDPAALEREALALGVLEPPQEADPRKRAAPEPRKPYREFRGARGSTILVGRTAADNDELTLRIARGNDVWLHARDTPGSHVVLRQERGAEPDPEELLDAATLAVHFSPLADAAKAAVHVARRKEVHKPKGAKPGLVSLSGGRTLEIRMQPDRLRRLLSSARGTGPAGEAPGGTNPRGTPGGRGPRG